MICVWFQEKERLCTQLGNFLEDNEVVEAAVFGIGEKLPNVWNNEEQLLIPLICQVSVSLKTNKIINKENLFRLLLSTFNIISELQTTETILSGFVLPALCDLTDLIKLQFPHLQEDLEQIISSLEASRNTKILEKGESLSSQKSHDEYLDEAVNLNDLHQQTNSEKVKEKVNKLFRTQGNLPFWKK